MRITPYQLAILEEVAEKGGRVAFREFVLYLTGKGRRKVRLTLSILRDRGLLTHFEDEQWRAYCELTPRGREAIEKGRRQNDAAASVPQLDLGDIAAIAAAVDEFHPDAHIARRVLRQLGED